MNMAIWKEELKTYKLEKKYKHIIRGFERGFDQGIRNGKIPGLRFFCPKNHKSALQAKMKIEENFKLEVEKGRMFGPWTKEEAYRKMGFFRTNPLGAVVNGDGSFRPISNLSYPKNDPEIESVNLRVDKDDFETSWDDFKTVAWFFTTYKGKLILGVFDWAKAYRQIPVAMDQWKFLMVLDFNDQVYVDTRVQFGGVAGCGTFGEAAEAWKEIMLTKFNLLRGFRWVDDTLFLKPADGSNKTTMREIADASQRLGVETNEKNGESLTSSKNIWDSFGTERIRRLDYQ
jgi:hypothetical protein